jgi:hypothetical protein
MHRVGGLPIAEMGTVANRLPATDQHLMNGIGRFAFLGCLVAILLFALGCGLSEYQEKFARQQERVNYLDRENEYLGKPIELPKKKEGDTGPRLAVFFRPPLGILTSPDEQPTGVLFHYGRAPSAKSAKGSSGKLSGVQDVYLSVTINKDWSDFKKEVFASIKGSEGKTTQIKTLTAPGRQPMTFETVSFTEGSDPAMNYQFYFFRNEIYRVALVFQGPEKVMNSEMTRESIELSLKSLAVGDAAKERARHSPP